jgi:hypothetical protein
MISYFKKEFETSYPTIYKTEMNNIRLDVVNPESFDQITQENWGIEYKQHQPDVSVQYRFRQRQVPEFSYDWMNPLSTGFMQTTYTKPLANEIIESDYASLLHHTGTISPYGPAMDTPTKIRIPLKPHQRRTLYEMHVRENMNYRLSHYNMLYLCDNVGSGKSLCMLAHIAQNPTVNMWSNIVRAFELADRKDKRISYGVVLDPSCVEFNSNLIVVPHNVYFQWVNYIRQYSDLTHIAIGATKDISGVGVTRETIIETLNSVNIVLVKSTMYQEFIEHLGRSGNLRHRSYSKQRIYTHQYGPDNTIVEYDEHGNPYRRQFSSDSTMLVDDERFTCHEQIESYIRHSYNMFSKEVAVGNLCSYTDFISKIEKIRERIDHEQIRRNNEYIECSRVEVIEGYAFQRVIFDEADSIKLPSCTHIFGKMTWCITSSMASLLYPMGQSRYSYGVNTLTDGMHGCSLLKTKINFIRTSYNVGTYVNRIFGCIVRNNPEFVMDSMSLPSPTILYHRCYTPSHISALNGNVDDALMRAMNAGDIDQAAIEIGCQVKSENDIIRSACTMYQSQHDGIVLRIDEKKHQIRELTVEREKYDNETKDMGVIENEDLKHERSRHSQNLYSRISYAKKSIDELQVDMKAVEARIHNIKERICESNDKSCPVCLDNCEKPTLLNCCKNIFCFGCIHNIMTSRSRCPMCRESINAESMSLILDISKYEKKTEYNYDEIEDFENQLTAPSEGDEDPLLYEKIDVLIRELMNNPTKRYLVFSEFNGTFNVIRDRLNQTGIVYEMLSGSTVHIQKTIQLFRENKIQVLLLNARFFGAGLNLQMTDEIIIYHRMNSDLEKQVIGRAQRLGRQTKLSIRYLCYNNEIPVEPIEPVQGQESSDSSVN